MVAPDLFEGNAVTTEVMDDVRGAALMFARGSLSWAKQPEVRANYDWSKWIVHNTPAYNLPRVKGVIDALRSEGATHFGATGYCYGGRIVFDLAFAGEIDVAAASHPSLLSDEDLEVRL